MTVEAATVFREALLAVKVLHDQHWLHGDLKPANIGLRGKPPRAVLLDYGSSAYRRPGEELQPEFGQGTLEYLAPEGELHQRDCSVDIWAMGVVGYELTYGRRPWSFPINPWRAGWKHEKLRPAFRKEYKLAIDALMRDCHGAMR